jgi:hypothetical protein
VPALGESRCDSALDLLRDLAADPKVLKHFEEPWINAVARLDTPAARELLLSFVDPEIRGLAAGIEMQWPDVLSFRIADLAKRFPEIERRLRQLTERDLPPVKRLRLAATLNVIGTPETLMSGLALIDDRAQPSIPRDTFVNIEAAFVERRPQGQASNTYVLAARAANVVRAALFEMVTRDDRRKKSAFALLGQIEQWRLEYGRPTGEPRHPAIRSGQPWPPNEPVA